MINNALFLLVLNVPMGLGGHLSSHKRLGSPHRNRGAASRCGRRVFQRSCRYQWRRGRFALVARVAAAGSLPTAAQTPSVSLRLAARQVSGLFLESGWTAVQVSLTCKRHLRLPWKCSCVADATGAHSTCLPRTTSVWPRAASCPRTAKTRPSTCLFQKVATCLPSRLLFFCINRIRSVFQIVSTHVFPFLSISSPLYHSYTP